MEQREKNLFFSKIGFRLLWFYVVFALVLGFSIIFASLYNYTLKIEALKDSQDSILSLAGSEIEAYSSSLVDSVRYFSKIAGSRGILNEADNRNLYHDLRRAIPSTYSLSIYDKDGRLVFKKTRLKAKEGAEKNSISPPTIFQEIWKNTTYHSEVYFVDGYPYVTVGWTIMDANNVKIGVLAADIELSILWDIIARMKFKENGYLYLVDQSGMVVSSAQQIRAENKHLNLQKTVGEYVSFNNEKVLGKYFFLKSLHWGVIAELPKSEMNRYLAPVFLGLTFSIVLFSFFFWMILRAVYKNILSPVSQLSDAVTAVKKGDFNHRISYSGDDELSDLCETFNNMSAELKTSRDKDKEYGNKLEKVVAERTKELQDKLNELQKFYRITVDREIKMAELKEKLKKFVKDK